MSEPAGSFFGDALLGADGTAEPRRRAAYGDALALDTAAAQEWGGFELPRLPVAPGADERAARALVEADPLQDVRAPLPVPRAAGQPVPVPLPVPRPASAPVPATPVQRSAPRERGGPPGWQAPARGRQAQPRTVPHPAPSPASAPAPTIRSSASGSLLAVLLVILVAAYLLIR